MKFFPAGLLGGPAAIRALAAPFTRMTFMPSGGVTLASPGSRIERNPGCTSTPFACTLPFFSV